MSATTTDLEPSQFTVLIAGGGVGGLEAILALREISDELRIELLSPDPEFVLAPLSVAEPFGAGDAPRLPIGQFCEDHGVTWTRDGLAEVWPEQRRALTESGDELTYDALLLAPGARRREAVQGALTFRGGGQASALETVIEEAGREGGRIEFIVPAGPTWPLPLYELALLVADRLSGTGAEVGLTTTESAPLEILGVHASERVAAILDGAGVEFQPSSGGAASAAGTAKWVVSLPVLDVPEIPGIAQAAHGFINTDTTLRVQGTKRAWAVGDVTWFPAKQGGIAAQQADVAAADIAATAGLPVEVPPFAPVLRVALLTPEGPYYLRSGSPDESGEQRAPLWWPPAKVAGRLLAPYLARRLDPDLVSTELEDREVDTRRDADHEEALALALVGADLDAQAGELKRALHWLEIAEGLNLVVPDEYREKKRLWEEQLAAEFGSS